MRQYFLTVTFLLSSFIILGQGRNNNNSNKTTIPKNDKNLMENPYFDWVSRWKYETFECDTMYYTPQVESAIIDSTISRIKKNRSFLIKFSNQKFEITSEEQSYLIEQLEILKNHRWTVNMFPNSKCIEFSQIETALKVTENLKTEKEKNLCSIVYTFSKPIFLRNSTVALFLDQKRYKTNYTQLEFSFYKLAGNRWEQVAVVYKIFESSK